MVLYLGWFYILDQVGVRKSNLIPDLSILGKFFWVKQLCSKSASNVTETQWCIFGKGEKHSMRILKKRNFLKKSVPF